MDKYEYNLKIDQIRQAVENRENISTAVKIADEIDWKKEKDVSVLVVAADAYELGRQYGKAKEMLLIAYEKAQTGKQLAYRLALLSAKTKEFGEAEEFYQDFVDMAPRDTARYVLRYRISKAKGEPIEDLIEILEEYVDIDMEEKWMYELAKLYHLAGDAEKCVDLCDEMSLWFSHGEFVRRAMDLKKKYKPLTKRQEENYYKTDEDIVQKNIEDESEEEENKGTVDTEENTKVKQATIPFTTLKAEQYNEQPEKEKNPKKGEKKVEDGSFVPEKTNVEDVNPISEKTNVEDTNPIPGEINVEDIHVKSLEGDGSDTMDIQAEIAKNIKEIMGGEEQPADVHTQEKDEPDRLTMTLDPLFKYDEAGQIGLDIEEPKKKDKQITGQLSIEEVLRSLEERGILKADTVNKTVETMDQAAEAVDKAAEEAAIKAENEKKNTTVVQDIEAKDLVEDGEIAEVQSALESFADDTVNGFVFTEEIDSAAIEEALLDSQQVTAAEEKAGEMSVAKTLDISEVKATTQEIKKVDFEPVVEEAKDIPAEVKIEENADVDADINLKAAESEQTINSDLEADESEQAINSDLNADESEQAINTDLKANESEQAINIDSKDAESEEITLEKSVSVLEVLNEETANGMSGDVPVLDLSFEVPVKKIRPGIAPNSEPVAANTASLKELFADLDEATKREIGILEEEKKETVSEDLKAEEKSETEESVQEKVSEEVSQEVTESEETKTEETDKSQEDSEETIKESQTEEVVNTETESEETKEESVAEEKSENADTEETVSEEEKSEVNAEESVASEEANQESTAKEIKAEDVPQVKVTTNTNLNRTMSLNLDKIIVTDEEMVPFDSFKSVNGLEQKIKDTVITLASTYEAVGNSKNGNIMILGDDKSGKTTMAIELIKLINKKRERVGRRIAKVDSSVLNTRGIRSSMKKLVGSDLIVENAHHLRKTVLAEFLSVGQYYTDSMLMVFEGETSALKTMRKENEDIAQMFDHVLVIKEYDVKEWVAYAKKFAATQNYMIDEMGTLALYKAIDDFYGRHQGIDQNDVENIVNHAIKKASSKVARKFTNLFSGKNDETGMDILKEVDFK